MEITSVVASAYGGPEVLSTLRATIGPPEPDQVLIEVRAAGTNPFDVKLYSGAFGSDPAALPLALGFELSGIVREVGGEPVGPTGPIAVGDEVIAFRVSGAYATGIVAPASAVLAKPASMSFEEASGLMLVGVTAVHALTATTTHKGDTLLVHGASGGVGLMAVQLAVADGVRVIATATSSQHDLLRSLGAEPVVYGDGLLERLHELAPDGITAAIDIVGTDEAIDVSRALLKEPERLVTIVATERSRALGVKAIGSGPGADPGAEIRLAARVELLRRVKDGTLRVIVAATYPLSEAAAAHRELAEGHAHGKIVLIP
jgi:NADPH:quinone reductase